MPQLSMRPVRDEVTNHLANVAAGIRADTLTEAARNRAADALLDHVACAAGGAGTDWGQAILRSASRWAGSGTCTVIGASARLPAAAAAYVNAQFGNMLDFDDTYLDLGHPGTTIFPAAWAVAEQEGLDTAALLAAVVAGYEVAVRYGLATRPSDERFRSVYPTAWHGIGAAVAACHLLDPTPEAITAAIGIAAEQVAAATALTTETTYAFKSGKMGSYAQTGVISAYLAAEGLHGKHNALDMGTPYWSSYGSDRFDLDVAMASPVERYAIEEVSFKPFPACRMTHTAAEAATKVGGDFGHRGISDIQVKTFTRAMQLAERRPRHAAHGPFCLPHVVAVAMLGLAPDAWYAPATLASPEVQRIADLVRLVPSQSFDMAMDRDGSMPCTLTTTYEDGRSAEVSVLRPLGDPARPLTHLHLQHKASTYLTARLGESRAAAATNMLVGITHEPRSVREATEFLRRDD